MKMLPVLFVASLLAVAATTFANDQAFPKTHADQELRTLLGVSSLHGKYTFPKQDKDKCFTVTTLKFENGKFIGTGNGSSGEMKSLPNRTVRVSFLWGDVNGKTTTLLSASGGIVGSQDAFLKNIGTPNGITSQTLQKPDEYKDYHILAISRSLVSIDGKSDHSSFGSDKLMPIVKKKKYVVALAVKSYTTREDASKNGVLVP